MYKIFVLLFVMHVVAGFFLQTKKVSKLKREKTSYLFIHVGLYTLFFIVFCPILLGLTILEGLTYSLINGVLHLVVDYTTGKFKNKYFGKNNLGYKLTVGIDYALHVSILIITYILMFKPSIFY
jgi:hypothetical protein